VTDVVPPQRIASAMTAVAGSRRHWRIVLLVLVAVVSYLAVTPMPPKDLTTGWDRLNHASAFAALALSGCLGYRGRRSTLLWLMLALLAFGGLIEVVQYFVPGRSCEWGDLFADLVGIAGGSLLALGWLAVSRRFERRDR
jgi:VanZ family protein